jgi:uncharacterized cupredoxin-like copper-binding protein
MKNFITTFALAILCSTSVAAEQGGHGPEATTVEMTAGTADGKHRFVPNEFTFERGKYYRLVIRNPSKDDHYFSSDAFATHIFTRKVEVTDHDGKTIAEIHGAVNDIELKAGSTVEWYFYPMTKGENLPLVCHKEGHAEAGMTGIINIVGPPPFSK